MWNCWVSRYICLNFIGIVNLFFKKCVSCSSKDCAFVNTECYQFFKCLPICLVKTDVILVLICIFLVNNDVKHLFICSFDFFYVSCLLGFKIFSPIVFGSYIVVILSFYSVQFIICSQLQLNPKFIL